MKILIIDDDEVFRETLIIHFADLHIEAVGSSSFKNLSLIDLSSYSHAVVDLRIAQENGLEVIQSLKSLHADMKIVMLTGFGSIATAVEAIKLGAHQYLTKPISFDVLIDTLFDNPADLASENDRDVKELTLAEKEREYIEFILNRHQGNISQAAKVLGLHRQSLQRMLKKYSPAKN